MRILLSAQHFQGELTRTYSLNHHCGCVKSTTAQQIVLLVNLSILQRDCELTMVQDLS